MTLVLAYRGQTTIPVEVQGITPDAVAGKSLGEIQRFELFHGNEKASLADFFTVTGDAADGQMRWEGDLSGVHWIAAGMKSGHVHVASHAGRHVGSEMSGGEVLVAGDAGDWLGGEMQGGTIRVLGRAGHQVGAAYRGSARGMTGGVILVGGDAGNEIGHSLRRGFIAIGGRAGDLTGFNMLAGTVLVFGSSGNRPGAGMRRGTLGFFGPEPPVLLPTFRYACRYRPEVLALLASLLRRHAFSMPAGVFESPVDLFNGDLLEGGRGEILVRAREG